MHASPGTAALGSVAVVDDDQAVRDALSFLFGTAGLAVRSFAGARELLDAVIDDVTCLIVDQSMPGMTGIELTGTLRDRGLAIPIILVTGSLDGRLAARARAAGATSVLEKPFYDDGLLDLVTGYLVGRASRPEAAP